MNSPPESARLSVLSLAVLSAVAAGAAAPVRSAEPANERPAAVAASQPSSESTPPAAAPARAPNPAPPAARAPDPPPAQPNPAAQSADDTAKRVVFLPESVKAELREQIKQEVMEQAKREGWASPNVVPRWLERITISGDVRGRWERDLFGAGNANGGEFPDFNAINNNQPFDVRGIDLSDDRYLNVDQNRTRPRLRARVAADADVGQGFMAVLRLASGESSTPISNNQTLGNFFSLYQIWLDRAYVKYEPVKRETTPLSIMLGRFDNPFFGTALLWWYDLAMDGGAIKLKGAVGGGFKPFLTAGALSLYTTALNFPALQTSKFPTRNKWLYAAQIGTDWTPSRPLLVKIGGAFYDFDNVEGHTSSPCDTNIKFVTCDTDDLRPSFAQKGNTYMALRTPSAAALAAEATSLAPRYQFFGLASRFRELAAAARLEYTLSAWLRLGVEAEYVYNAGFKKSEIAPVALNNRGPVSEANPLGAFVGGNQGALGQASLGTPELNKLGDWRARFAYRYIESDAVVDAFNDPDFGLGGTNLKGYSVDFTLALANGVSTMARWFSADQVSGPKLGIDVLQIDFMAAF